MNTLRALVAAPFIILGLAFQVLFLPSLVLFGVWAIWGTHSAAFGWGALIWCGWVWLEWRTLRGARHPAGGRRLY